MHFFPLAFLVFCSFFLKIINVDKVGLRLVTLIFVLPLDMYLYPHPKLVVRQGRKTGFMYLHSPWLKKGYYNKLSFP